MNNFDLTERLRSMLCPHGCGSMKVCVCTTAEDAADLLDEAIGCIEALLPYAETTVPNPISVGEINAIDRARAIISRFKCSPNASGDVGGSNE